LPNLYEDIINKIYPCSEESLINLPCFYQVDIKDYFTILFEGEKKYGRTIFLEDLGNGQIKLQFIRFAN